MIRPEALRQEAGRDDLAPGPRFDLDDVWDASGRPRGKSPHPGRRTTLAHNVIARLSGRPAGSRARRDLPRRRRAQAPPDALPRGTTTILLDDASPETLVRNACESAPGCPPTRPRPLLARLGPDCPTRPVDWRWQRAGLMLELGLRWSRRRDDGPTREAKRYRAALRRCRDDAGRERLDARMPGVAGACAIRNGEPRVRWAVEARLLAGEAIDAVAREVDLMPEAVAWYEGVFFHVSDRLVSRGYLVHVAIGPRLHRGPMAQDIDLLWKVFGVFVGPEALDGLIRSTWDAAGEPRRFGEALPELVSLPGPMGLALAATTLPGGLGGRCWSKALLRLAASERRYAERAHGATALIPESPAPPAGGADPLMIASGPVVNAIATAGSAARAETGPSGTIPAWSSNS